MVLLLQQDHPSQGVSPEQEARKTINQRAEVLSFLDKASQYRKHHLSDELIERANKPYNATSRTSVISKTTQAVVAIGRQKLCKTRTEWFMSDSYIAKVTKCGRRQNRDIIGQINGTKFNITRCRKRKGWILKPLETEHAKRRNIAALESPVALEEQSVEGIPYKNNNIKNIRSNAQAHESKFLGNSNSSNSLPEQVKTTEAKDTTCENVDSLVKAVSKKKLKSNLRKKPTTAERKASKAKVYKFNQYNKPKNLTEHYPLSQEDCYELQKRSGKAYNLNAMNEILLDMSRKPKESKHMFESKARFMSYMTKAYKNEGRDVDKANLPGFKITKRRPQAEVTEITTLAQREKYLNQVENSAIYARCDYTQYRARIAGQFPINLGYDLLTNMVEVKRDENVLKIAMHKPVPLGENHVQSLLNHAKGIGGYAGVSELLIQQYSFT